MWKQHRKLNFPNIFRLAAIYTWAPAFKSGLGRNKNQENKAKIKKLRLLGDRIDLGDWVNVYILWFMYCSQIFHSYGDVTMTAQGLQYLSLCRSRTAIFEPLPLKDCNIWAFAAQGLQYVRLCSVLCVEQKEVSCRGAAPAATRAWN